MNSLNCDVCHKSITTAVNGRTCFHIAHRDLCEDCYNRLNYDIKSIMRTKQPFNYEWYDRLVMDSIERAMTRGKW